MVRGDRSVDVFVRKLRQKLEKASPEWRYIHTHFGIGYRFAAEPTDGLPAEGGEVSAAPLGGEDQIARRPESAPMQDGGALDAERDQVEALV
jgi:DNA-binding winged helix-turn-helix (wHTH) protein